MAFNTERTVPTILADLLSQFTSLLHKEGELARAEMSEKISQVGNGLTLIVTGAVLLMPALVILLMSAVAGLERAGLEPVWASLAVGGGVLLVGLILLMAGVSRLRARKLMPNKTIHQLQEDAAATKRQVRTENDYQRAA